MKAKKLVHKAFAFVFLSGVVGLSLFTRRSYAMDIKSQAPIGYFTPTNEPKDEVIPKLVTVTITPTKQELEQQSFESEKIPAFSGEQLPSSLPVSTHNTLMYHGTLVLLRAYNREDLDLFPQHSRICFLLVVLEVVTGNLQTRARDALWRDRRV